MKEKISITLDDQILKKIETIANKQGINRSKFIENILMEKLENTPVLILAGWSEINSTPKSLLKFKGQRIISKQIDLLERVGLNNLYISLNSLDLKSFIEKNHPNINIIFEEKKIGSGGTLKKFAKHVNSRFLFMHCDILFDLDLNKPINFHIEEKSDLTLVLKSSKNSNKYGTATMEGKRIIDFNEKPKDTDIFLIYVGIGVADPRIFDKIDDVGKFELQLSKISNKTGYIYEGFWKNFESSKDFE